jgi:hypothetical protein
LVVPKPSPWHSESSFDSHAAALLQVQYARALQVSFCKVSLQKNAGLEWCVEVYSVSVQSTGVGMVAVCTGTAGLLLQGEPACRQWLTVVQAFGVVVLCF